jgi:hypothetical protein
MNLCAALTDDDVTTNNTFATELLYTQTLSI